MGEIEEIIAKVKNRIPNIIVSQHTDIGEKPSEFGIWQFWLEVDENRRISVEIQNGFVYACYSSDELSNQDPFKYQNTAKWICNYFQNN